MENQRRHALSNTNLSHTNLINIHSDLVHTIGKNPSCINVIMPYGFLVLYMLEKKNKSMMIEKFIKPIIALCASRDRKINTIHSDCESIYVSLTDDLKSRGILSIQCAPSEHDSIAERSIRTLKSKVISTLASLRYKIQIFMIPYLLKWVIDTVNITPNHTGLTPFYHFYSYNPSPEFFKFHFGQVIICAYPYPKGLIKTHKAIVLGRNLLSLDTIQVLDVSNNTIVLRSLNSSEALSDEGSKIEIEKFSKSKFKRNNNNNNDITEIFEEEDGDDEVVISKVVQGKEVLTDISTPVVRVTPSVLKY